MNPMNRRFTALFLSLFFPISGLAAQPIFEVGVEFEKGDYQIMKIGVFAETDANNNIKNIYVDTSEKRFEITLAQIASGKPTTISYRGIQMATIQGLSKSKTGEGWLRITPTPKRVARNATDRARSIDVYILPTAHKSYWKAIYNQNGTLRWITEANLVLDKNPFEMSVAEILFSPPKIIDMLPNVAQCEYGSGTFHAAFFFFGVKRGLEFSGCDTRKLTPEVILDMLLALNSHPFYLNYEEHSVSIFNPEAYIRGLPKKPAERTLTNKLEQFRKVAFDFSAPANRDLLNLDFLFLQLVGAGELEAIEYLFSLGVYPKNISIILPAALSQVYRFNIKSEELEITARSKGIFDLIYGRRKADETFDIKILFQELASIPNASLNIQKIEHSPMFTYLVKTLLLAKDSKVFTFNPEQEYIAEELIYDLSGYLTNNAGDAYLNDVQMAELIKQLNEWNQ